SFPRSVSQGFLLCFRCARRRELGIVLRCLLESPRFPSCHFWPLGGWRETPGWRRSNLCLKGRSAAVLAFVLAHRFAVSKVRVSPPFQLCVPDHPQGYWLAESVGTAMVSDAHLVFLHHCRSRCLG